ncbi:MAG: hypothetical protein H0X24_22165 [Ktedonobacterales bacterium]|nr:hypothetical protein [Ktedonobacterales bacterium]
MVFPLGPYHPALTEPLGVQFALRGETITDVAVTAGYTHRGVEALVVGHTLADALDVIERTCGSDGHSLRLAACLALEAHAGITPPERARALRTIFSEVERLQARLWYLMQIARVSQFGALLTACVEARESLFEACVSATETRLFWGIATPGGARGIADPLALQGALSDIEGNIATIERLLNDRGPMIRRLTNVGVIPTEAIDLAGVTGAVARASGSENDLRLTAPYDAYGDLDLESMLNTEQVKSLIGDVGSRAFLAVAEIRQSMAIIEALLDELPDGQEASAFPALLEPGTASATVESPHGQTTVTLTIGASGGKSADTQTADWLTELTIQPASVATAALLPAVLTRQKLSDALVILTSLDLCVACLDR